MSDENAAVIGNRDEERIVDHAVLHIGVIDSADIRVLFCDFRKVFVASVAVGMSCAVDFIELHEQECRAVCDLCDDFLTQLRIPSGVRDKIQSVLDQTGVDRLPVYKGGQPRPGHFSAQPRKE